MRHSSTALVAFTLALAGCGEAQEPARDETAAPVLGNTASSANDPALLAALRDQIMVDPGLVQQANADAVRPPTRPESGAVPPDGIAAAAMRRASPSGEALRSAPAASPTCRQCDAARRSLTLGALAEAQGGRAGQCAADVSYSAGWANRLPAFAPLYPDARVAEAAGTDRAGCALRVVSFASAAPMTRLLDWYFTRASAAGFSAEHGTDGAEHVLAGARSGAAFMAVMRTRPDGGTNVDLMADGG